jgi:hypothetical protein
MKYTKEQLEGMSDAELNANLHMELLGSPWKEHADLSANKKYICLHNIAGDPYFEDVPDYCTNWNDIMPLAVEHNVTYIKNERSAFSGLYIDDEYDCYYGFKLKVENDVPQRAIACCLILVLQEQ